MGVSDINNKELEICISKTVSNAGTIAFNSILNVWILDYFKSSSILGTANFWIGLTSILCSFLGGILADSKYLMGTLLLTDLLSSFLCIFFALTTSFQSLIGLYVLVSLLNINIYIASPMFKTMTGQIIVRSKIISFNTKLSFILQIITMTVPPISAALYSYKFVNMNSILFINAFSFLVSLLCMILLRRSYHSENQNIKSSLQFLPTLRYLFTNNKLLALIFAGGILNFSLAGFNILSPYLASSVLKNSSLYGWFLSMEAVGNFLGILSIKFIKMDRNIRVERLMLVFSGVLLFLAIYLKSITLFGLTSILLCIALSRYNVASQSFIQLDTPKQMIGKTFSIMFTITNFGTAIGSLLFGQLIDLNLSVAALLTGIGMMFPTSIWIFLKRKNQGD